MLFETVELNIVLANIMCHAFDARYLIFDSFVFFALHIKLNNEMWSTLTAHWIWFVDDNHVFVMISTSQWKNFSVQDDDAHELVSLAFSLDNSVALLLLSRCMFPFYVSILWIKLSDYSSSSSSINSPRYNVTFCNNWF